MQAFTFKIGLVYSLRLHECFHFISISRTVVVVLFFLLLFRVVDRQRQCTCLSFALAIDVIDNLISSVIKHRQTCADIDTLNGREFMLNIYIELCILRYELH